MKKTLLGTLMLLLAISVNAQDDVKPHIIYMQTTYMGQVEGGSGAEFDSLQNLMMKNVTSKSNLLISQQMMRHRWGSDNRQLILVQEFANMEDLLKFIDLNNGDLFRAYWDTEEKRKAFGAALSKYYKGSWHSDEIYEEIPGGRK
jgi:hypothetical protein